MGHGSMRAGVHRAWARTGAYATAPYDDAGVRMADGYFSTACEMAALSFIRLF